MFPAARPGSQVQNIMSSSLLVHWSTLFQETLAGRGDGAWPGHILIQKRDIPWLWLRNRSGTASSNVFLFLSVSVATEIQTAKSSSWFCKNGAYAPKAFRQIFKLYLKSEVNLSQRSLLNCRYLPGFWPWTLLKPMVHI